MIIDEKNKKNFMDIKKWNKGLKYAKFTELPVALLPLPPSSFVTSIFHQAITLKLAYFKVLFVVVVFRERVF